MNEILTETPKRVDRAIAILQESYQADQRVYAKDLPGETLKWLIELGYIRASPYAENIPKKTDGKRWGYQPALPGQNGQSLNMYFYTGGPSDDE